MSAQAGIYVSLLVALTGSVALAWSLSLGPRRADLSGWRVRVFFVGLVANTVSLALFVVVNLHTLLISRGIVGATDLVHSYRAFLPLELTAASIICGALGRRVPRFLVVVNGLVLGFLWLNYGAASL
jgi:hypothetical protein